MARKGSGSSRFTSPVPDFVRLLEEATVAVARARDALAAGEIPDLRDTATMVDRAVEMLAAVTADQLPTARLKLLGLLDEISALVVRVTELHGETAGQLAGLDARRRAVMAYAGGSPKA